LASRVVSRYEIPQNSKEKKQKVQHKTFNQKKMSYQVMDQEAGTEEVNKEPKINAEELIDLGKTIFYDRKVFLAHLVFVLLLSFMQYLPFWIQQYVPITMSYQFYIFALMYGCHALCCHHYRMIFLGFHCFFSLVALGTFWMYMNELNIAPAGCGPAGSCSTREGVTQFTNYSHLATTNAATVINTTVWANGNHAQALLMYETINSWNAWYWIEISLTSVGALMHFVGSAHAIFDLYKQQTRFFQKRYSRYNDFIYCGRHNRKFTEPYHSWITLLNCLGILNGIFHVVLSLYLTSQSIVVLNPITNMDFLIYYLVFATLYLPQPSSRRSRFTDEFNWSKDPMWIKPPGEPEAMIRQKGFDTMALAANRNDQQKAIETCYNRNTVLKNEAAVLVFGHQSSNLVHDLIFLWVLWFIAIAFSVAGEIANLEWLGGQSHTAGCSSSVIKDMLNSHYTFGFFTNQTYVQYENGLHLDLPTKAMGLWTCIDQGFTWGSVALGFIITIFLYPFYIKTILTGFNKIWDSKTKKIKHPITIDNGVIRYLILIFGDKEHWPSR